MSGKIRQNFLVRVHCLKGWASLSLPPGGQAPPGASMEPLLDTILQHVPPPAPTDKDKEALLAQPFAMVRLLPNATISE